MVIRLEVHPEWLQEEIFFTRQNRIKVARFIERELDLGDEILDYPDLHAFNELVYEELQKRESK